MHVALVCPYAMSAPGGVQEHVRGLAAALVRRGVDVTLLAPELDRARREALAPVTAISLGRAVPVPANGSIAPLGVDPRMVARIELALDPADVIHLHEPFLPVGLWTLLRRPRGTRVVGTFHAAAERFAPYALAKPLLRVAARRLDATTAVSEAARSLVARYVALDPEIVPNGVDAAAYAEAAPDPWAGSLGTVVLFVGRPERRKGFDTAVRAFVGAAARRDDAHLVCFPATPGDAAALAEEVPGRVHCLGPVTHERKLALFKAADVVLLPARGGESFGIVVVEALAAGAAVLAGDIDGYRRAGGDAAEYLQPDDLRAWRRRLDVLLDEPSEREALARGGPERARTFDWAAIADRTMGVYAS